MSRSILAFSSSAFALANLLGLAAGIVKSASAPAVGLPRLLASGAVVPGLALTALVLLVVGALLRRHAGSGLLPLGAVAPFLCGTLADRLAGAGTSLPTHVALIAVGVVVGVALSWRSMRRQQVAA